VLVDVGGASDGLPETDPHPNGSRKPGTWIARYVKRHLPESATAVDYALITHFHADHMGGLIDFAAELPIRTFIDRGWPDYRYPAPDDSLASYRHFLAGARGDGMVVEQFRPGAHNQIRLRHDAPNYPVFEVRNIVGNGQMWTGEGESVHALFPSLDSIPRADWPTENMCSLGIRITYGRFRFFTGGDLPGTADPGFPAWHALEAAIAPVIGRVDVHVVNQHGSMGEETDAFLGALQSTVLIVPSWAPSHPAPDVLKRIMNSRLPPSPRYVFATDLRPSARTVIGQRADQLAAPPGHIVVRVSPGGDSYRVYVLDSADESDRVIAVKGPFRAQ
jgi:beta-lactamase superfamily II metal-dependent hydrolase